VGSQYWAGLVDWLRERMLGAGNIDADDFGLLQVTDDVEEVVRICLSATHRQWGEDDE
jgi:predicted Rossmann-fold nucleotide-binding protein